MEIADVVSRRSTCLRRKIGAVLVRNKQILATGYNGAPQGLEHCSKVGCLRKKLKIKSGEHSELCRGVHAEQNVIIQAALHGISTQNSTLYSLNYPCSECSKMLINAGIQRIVAKNDYPNNLSKKLLHEAKIQVDLWRKIE